MIALLVILVILGVIVFLVVGVDVGYEKDGFWVILCVGPFRLKLLPKDKEKAAPPKHPKPEKKPKEKKEKKEKKKPDFQLIKGLISLGLRALGDLRRKLTIDLFSLELTVGGEDPFKVIDTYGKLNMILGMVWPLADNVLQFRQKNIHTDFCFEQEKTEVSAQLILSLAIWEILYIGIRFGFGFLRLYLSLKRQRKREAKAKEKAAEPVQAAAANS